jgi:hypothetical protein
MPSLTRSLHVEFEKQVQSIESTRSKMEQLFSSSQLNNNDIEHVYAGLFMELFTNFEALLEELFFGILAGTLFTRTYTIVKLARIAPISESKNIVFAGKPYEMWLPYKENTLKRAKRFFKDGEPFSKLTDAQIANITDYHKIRNAIAHKSENSLDNFNKIISSLPLLPAEKTPTGYLRSKPSGVGQTQFEIVEIELKVLTLTLCQ